MKRTVDINWSDVKLLRTVASNNPRHHEDELVLDKPCKLCDLANRIEEALKHENHPD